MSESDFTVASQSGPYDVKFTAAALTGLAARDSAVIVIDRRVLQLYGASAQPALDPERLVVIDALEDTKSLERIPAVLERLVALGVRRRDEVVAVGGGITQDIVAFVATVMFRGMEWSFLPTTLLAQADSCIGSKSSINAAGTKNLVGTFHAPRCVTIDTAFLATLPDVDIRSGIGEMLKVHAIAGPAEFDRLAAEYDRLFNDDEVMRAAIHRSLLMKRALIELDEFDKGARNVMNYGHSFGHAIEAATDYGIPHGIAVTVGMDMANFVSARLGISGVDQFERMHPTLLRNISGFENVDIPVERLLAALSRDKKNTATHLRLVLVDHQGRIGLTDVDPNGMLPDAVAEYLQTIHHGRLHDARIG